MFLPPSHSSTLAPRISTATLYHATYSHSSSKAGLCICLPATMRRQCHVCLTPADTTTFGLAILYRYLQIMCSPCSVEREISETSLRHPRCSSPMLHRYFEFVLHQVQNNSTSSRHQRRSRYQNSCTCACSIRPDRSEHTRKQNSMTGQLQPYNPS